MGFGRLVPSYHFKYKCFLYLKKARFVIPSLDCSWKIWGRRKRLENTERPPQIVTMSRDRDVILKRQDLLDNVGLLAPMDPSYRRALLREWPLDKDVVPNGAAQHGHLAATRHSDFSG